MLWVTIGDGRELVWVDDQVTSVYSGASSAAVVSVYCVCVSVCLTRCALGTRQPQAADYEASVFVWGLSAVCHAARRGSFLNRWSTSQHGTQPAYERAYERRGCATK